MADKKAKEDLQFSDAELVSDDLREADKALEKRNSPAPEGIRDNLDKTSWPLPEDRKPAVMPADKEESLDYKLETYEKVDDKHRDHELTHGVGSVALAETTKLMNEVRSKGESANDVQAPPSAPAKDAAEGKGAENTPIPTANRDGLNARAATTNRRR